MKVRATQDGHYGGYYRQGPVMSDAGYTPGEIFEIEDKPTPVLDIETGEPIMDNELDEKGNNLIGKDGKPRLKMRMISHFSKVWMERVPDDTPVTNLYPKCEIPPQYREIKPREHLTGVKAIPVPANVI